MSGKQKLELTWIGKDKRPKLEPRILLEDAALSYHARHRVSDNDSFDNRLIPSLIVNDRWGNPVINPEYNATMLAEVLAKLEGFSYAPSETRWWQHGHSSERDFIYVTSQNLSADQLQALSDEVGGEQSLLVCCAAFRGLGANGAAQSAPAEPAVNKGRKTRIDRHTADLFGDNGEGGVHGEEA